MAAPATPADGVVWITGASSGIGRALSLELARRGFTVAATARSGEALQSLAAAAPEGRIMPFVGDVTEPQRLAAIVTEIEEGLGGIAVAILNAGLYLPVGADPFEPTKFEKSFAVNVMGVVNGLAPLLPRMIARGKGQLWLMASVAGYGALPTSAAYGATKAALINLAGALKFDLDRTGVHIGVISPGFVDTPATEGNPFPMPFLIGVEEAARRIADGLARPRFEIAFPRRFALMLKALNLLPYAWYFPLVARATGWNKRKVSRSAS